MIQPILDFAGNHVFIALFALFQAFYLSGLIIRLCWRALRTLNVLFRGWPPEHLDADGDWKQSPKPPED